MEQFIHYIGRAYFQQPIRAMQFNAAKTSKAKLLQKLLQSSFFGSSFKKQRSSSYAAVKSAARITLEFLEIPEGSLCSFLMGSYIWVLWRKKDNYKLKNN